MGDTGMAGESKGRVDRQPARGRPLDSRPVQRMPPEMGHRFHFPERQGLWSPPMAYVLVGEFRRECGLARAHGPTSQQFQPNEDQPVGIASQGHRLYHGGF